MVTLGIYIYNADRNAWLQEDEHSWGSLFGAVEFTAGHEADAEETRERVSGEETTFVMVALT